MTSMPTNPVAGLSSRSPSERARAATWLLGHPEEISTQDLMRALQAETVPQVRRALVEVLERRQKSSLTSQSEPHSSIATENDAASTVVDHVGDIASLIRHELSPAVGWIRLAADAEIEGFASSRTNDAVRRLQLRIDGLVSLIKSRVELDLRLIDLPTALVSTWPDPVSHARITPEPQGATVEIQTDEGLFSLLLANVFQNAIDASVDAIGHSDVEVAWGVTERNYWVRVTNPFRGERLSFDDVASDGLSSKPGHQGKGLALIKTIASRLDITITLGGASGTASFALSGKLRHG